MTWSELDQAAQQFVVEHQVKQGKVVPRAARAGIDFAAALHGCLRAGAVLVPLPSRASPAELEAARADCTIGPLTETAAQPSVAAQPPPQAAVHVVYTSGTSGLPKGVRLTLENHRASAAGCQEALGTDAGDKWLLVLSPHHVGGLAVFMRSVFSGQPVATLPRFDETSVLQALAQQAPTLLSVVPTMLVRLLHAGGLEQLRKLRAILVGGAPASRSVVMDWARLGLPVCPSYGLTESCSQVAVVPPGRAAELAGSSGFPHSRALVEIVGGEVTISGPVLSPGYVHQPFGGRFATGDLGRFDAEGALHVTGRKDDVIITGGENVNPEEVEAVLRAHPAVRDAAVAGRPDTVYGQVLEALVVADLERPAALVEWCRERLPSHKVPRRVKLVQEVPRSEGGKLLRRDL